MPEIEYVWDELSDNVIEEYEDGVLSVSYDHEPGLYGNLLSQNRNGITSYYHYDGRGDTVALTDDAGNVTDTKDYDAWGNAIASTGSTVTQYQFGGRHGYQTGNTGVYVRARLYQPIVARWLSVDPLWQDVEGSFWKYCENLPISDIDPSGLVSVRVENYSTDSDGPLNCQSKRAGVAYRYSVPKWPCRAISTHQLFIQKLSITYEFSLCCGARECKDSGTFYEFFKKERDADVGPLKAVPFEQDSQTVILPTGSFEGWSGYYEAIREEIRFYCIVPDNTRGTLKSFEIRDSEVATGYSTKQWACFKSTTQPTTDEPPGFWNRSRGWNLPPGKAGYWLGWYCCGDAADYVVQSSRPS